MKSLRPVRPYLHLAPGLAIALFLAGCGSGTVATQITTVTTAPVTTPIVVNPPVIPPVVTPPVFPVIPPVVPSGTAFTGIVTAGTQPIAGSTVQLYAAGTTGNGSAPTALLTAALTTSTTGAFSVPSGYTCPSPSSQLYLVARGGGIASLPSNSAITFLTTLGACSQIAASATFVLNEVTTVANAWALRQFLSNGANIGATATNTIGLANAVATAASLVNPATGTSPGTAFPTSGSSPAPRINSLANLLNTCTSAAPTSATCTTLLASPSGSPSTDVLDAALRIARSPAANVTALYTQSKSSAAFTPVLAAAPSDWTLFISFTNAITGTGLHSPSGVAVDSTGSIWVADYYGGVSKFSATGQPIFPASITGYGLKNSFGATIDASDNLWVPNEVSSGVNSGLGSVTVLNSSGQPVSGSTGFTAGGLDYPISVAIETDTTAWVLDYGNSHLTHLSSSGASLSGAAGYTFPGLAFPVFVAVDAAHNVWIANQGGLTVTKMSPDGTSAVDYNCCNGASGLAIDRLGNVWVSNYFGDSVSELSSSGAVLSSGYTASGTIYHPEGIAVDGAGSVWVTNFRASYLTQLAGAATSSPGQALSPAPGWAPDANLFGAFALAIDASGNVWVANFNNNSITEFVGMATPVKTPFVGPAQTP